MKRAFKILFVTLLLTGFSTSVWAQSTDNANITASADVIAALSVTGNSNLAFGDVSPGVNKTIATDGGGLFTVAGGAGASVDLQFSTLPASLSDGATNTLAISYTANFGDTYPGSGSDFNPTEGASFTGSPTIPADGDMSVFLGGTVAPTAGQVAGTYTGTVTLTATYN